MWGRGVAGGLLAIVLVLAGVLALGCGSSATATATPTTTAGSVAATASPDTTDTTISLVTTTTAASASTLAPSSSGDFLVSAGATLKDAFTELGGLFAKQSGVTPTFNFAASGVLQKQIEGGAPVQVFASASPKQVDALTKENLVNPSTTATFAGNTMVLIVPVGSTLGISSFVDLTRADVQKVTIEDPVTAPAGVSAVEVLTSLNVLSQVKPKLVYSANDAQTLDYVARGEVDAGLIFSSEVQGSDKVKIVATADQTLYTPVKYVITMVKAATSPSAAQAFIAFVLSDEGQAVLAKYGFKPAPK
jgi:molybdate transport system substrate-binding protein